MKISTDKTHYSAKLLAHLTKALLGFVCMISLCDSVYAKNTADNSSAAEYAVKAAYIFNILRFVNWDENTPLTQAESLNICLFKKNPFNRYLEPITKKSIGDKKIKLVYIDNTAADNNCHLIFINDKDEFDNQIILQQSNPDSAILLGNNIEFVKRGGLFSFYIENNKVKLAANRKTINDTQLNISSLLIEVCRLYDEQHGEQQ